MTITRPRSGSIAHALDLTCLIGLALQVGHVGLIHEARYLAAEAEAALDHDDDYADICVALGAILLREAAAQ